MPLLGTGTRPNCRQTVPAFLIGSTLWSKARNALLDVSVADRFKGRGEAEFDNTQAVGRLRFGPALRASCYVTACR